MRSYCVAIDPGGTTGLALIVQEEHPWNISVKHIGPDQHHQELYEFLSRWQPKVIVYEAWDNRSKEEAKVISPEYIGIIKLYAAQRTLQAAQANNEASRPVVVPQSAATGKGGFWKGSAKLRQYNLYVPSMVHARDAIRHYAYWRTFTRKDQSVLAEKVRPRVSVL